MGDTCGFPYIIGHPPLVDLLAQGRVFIESDIFAKGFIRPKRKNLGMENVGGLPGAGIGAEISFVHRI